MRVFFDNGVELSKNTLVYRRRFRFAQRPYNEVTVFPVQDATRTETASSSSTASRAWSGPKYHWTTRKSPCTDCRWQPRTTGIRPSRRSACFGSRCSTSTTTGPRSPAPASCFRYAFSATVRFYCFVGGRKSNRLCRQIGFCCAFCPRTTTSAFPMLTPRPRTSV